MPEGYGTADGSRVFVHRQENGSYAIILIVAATRDVKDVATSELVGAHVYTRLSMSVPLLIFLNMLLVEQHKGVEPPDEGTQKRLRPVAITLSEDKLTASLTFMRPLNREKDCDERGVFLGLTVYHEPYEEGVLVRVVIGAASAWLLSEAFANEGFREIVEAGLAVREGLAATDPVEP